MSRLWDKGMPLDERVLRYTAGEDHVLDARLVDLRLLDDRPSRARPRPGYRRHEGAGDGRCGHEVAQDCHYVIDRRLVVQTGVEQVSERY